jgi:hypothetical protein
LTALVLSAAPALADGSDASGNAAVKYWQAFGLLPRCDKDQEKLLQDWDKVPLDQATVQLVEAGKGTLLYLHRGAALPRCDWQLDLSDGPMLLMPHLECARNTARLACLRARWKFHEGKPQEAVEDVAAVLTLARHTGNDGTMISILVSFAIERMAIHAVQADFAKLDAATLKYMSTKMEQLPKVKSMHDCILCERDYMLGWMIKEVKKVEAEKPGSWKDVVKQISSEKDAERVFQAVDAPDKLIRLLDGLLPMYDEMAKMLSLPRDQFDAKWKPYLLKAQTTNVLTDLLIPALDKMVSSEQQAQTRTALFRAALEVALVGPEKAKKLADPFGSGRFVYKEIPGGFSLQSELKDKDGKQLIFYAGRAPKK